MLSVTRPVASLLCALVCALPAAAQPEPPPPYPLDHPTSAQIEAARTCDLASGSVPDPTAAVSLSRLARGWGANPPDEAALCAAAQALRIAVDIEAVRRGEPLPLPSAEQRALFRAVVHANPAYALREELIGFYFGNVDLTAQPAYAETSALVMLEIDYTYRSLGTVNDYHIVIYAIDTPSPQVVGVAFAGIGAGSADDIREAAVAPPLALPDTVAPKVVRPFGTALTDLVPISAPVAEAIACYDSYPDWRLTLTYADGTRAHIASHDSNVLAMGGPFTLSDPADGYVGYLLYSPKLNHALLDLFEALDLPLGAAMATACGGTLDLFPIAYPPRQP